MINPEVTPGGQTRTALTICSSYRPFDEPYIRRNYELLKYFNPDVEWAWLIADNGVVEGSGPLDMGDDRFTLIEGVPIRSVPYQEVTYRYAAAMRKVLPHVASRFLLVLDPDCYIVQPGWIKTVISYMQSEQLSFFGVPWHPNWYRKYRNFPCTHCMFIDLERIDLKDLDFSPHGPAAVGPKDTRVQDSVRPLVPRRLRPWLKSAWNTRHRRGIGGQPDIGDGVHRAFAGRPEVRYQLAAPVFDPARRRATYGGVVDFFSRALDAWLPDRLSYVPKKKGYFTIRGFRELGFPDARSHNWEEYMWQGIPFAFHLRRFMRGVYDPADEIRLLTQAIDDVRALSELRSR